jgi:hypothetical protein
MKKSEKRARGEARAAIHRADSIASGLKAQKRDREARLKRQKSVEQAEKAAKAKKAINGMKPETGYLAPGS